MKRTLALAFAGMLLAGTAHATVSFSTFVDGGDINTALNNNATIAFNYTGSGFVGSVYFGPNNNQLFSTDLQGKNVKKYGDPIPGFSGEVVVGVGLGQAGFSKGAVYAGNGNGNQIFLVPQSGAPQLFATTGNPENIRQIFFDPGSSFGGQMIVTTSSGNIYSFNSAGVPKLIAGIGIDTEGVDIASAAFGKYAGQLIVASEGSGTLRAIKADGTVTLLHLVDANGNDIGLGSPETVSTVPLDLGKSGNPVEGFYVANYPVDIQVAPAAQFDGLQGDVIVTAEDSINSRVWDIHYNGDALDTFTVTLVGNMPNQSEDGIFVTAQRQVDLQVPEPMSLALLGTGLLGAGALRLRRKA